MVISLTQRVKEREGKGGNNTYNKCFCLLSAVAVVTSKIQFYQACLIVWNGSVLFSSLSWTTASQVFIHKRDSREIPNPFTISPFHSSQSRGTKTLPLVESTRPVERHVQRERSDSQMLGGQQREDPSQGRIEETIVRRTWACALKVSLNPPHVRTDQE